MKKIKSLIWVVALAAAGYAVYWVFAPAEAVFVYRTQPVTRGSIVSTVNATGRVNAVEMVDVGTQVSGTISEIFVDFNSPVTRGQLLARLDPEFLQSRVEESRAGLAVARASVARAQTEVASAQRNSARSNDMWERRLIARIEMENAETQLSVARAILTEANSRVLQAQESLRQAETNLSHTEILSPIDGIVISRQIDVGQTVAASLQAPVLFSIARDLTQMQIEASIDESDIGRVREGQRAVSRFDSWPGEPFEAVVVQRRLNPEIISNVVTYVVILMVDNEDNLLMPGMTANISIETERRDDVLKIPAAAMRFTPPAEAVAAIGQLPGSASASTNRPTTGLLPLPQRGMGRGRAGAESGNDDGRTVWLVEDGRLTGSVVVNDTGISDRMWIELRGDAVIQEGQELAIAFTTEAAGAATAGGRR